MTTVLEPRPRSSGDARPGGESAGTGVDEADHRITRLPILILYPHSRCNCRCLMCDIWRATTRDELDPAAVGAEIDRWLALGVRRVVLSGGEPLMHRDLRALARPLAEAGIGVTLLSTGLLLARHAADIVRYVDDIVLSLDGPRETHDAIRRVPRAFDRLAEGIAAVRAAAKSTRRAAAESMRAKAAGIACPSAAGGPPAPPAAITISSRCTVQRANCDQLRATVRAAQALGLDRLSFLAVDASSEAFNRPGGWSRERRQAIAPGLDDLPRLRVELDRLYAEQAEDFASGFVAESPAKLEQRLYDFFTALAGRGDFPPVTCNAPWVSAVIEADGTVRPCFFHRAIGRWEGGDLAAVLNGPEALAFRAGLDVATNPTCRRCVCSLNLARAI